MGRQVLLDHVLCVKVTNMAMICHHRALTEMLQAACRRYLPKHIRGRKGMSWLP